MSTTSTEAQTAADSRSSMPAPMSATLSSGRRNDRSAGAVTPNPRASSAAGAFSRQDSALATASATLRASEAAAASGPPPAVAVPDAFLPAATGASNRSASASNRAKTSSTRMSTKRRMSRIELEIERAVHGVLPVERERAPRAPVRQFRHGPTGGEAQPPDDRHVAVGARQRERRFHQLRRVRGAPCAIMRPSPRSGQASPRNRMGMGAPSSSAAARTWSRNRRGAPARRWRLS